MRYNDHDSDEMLQMEYSAILFTPPTPCLRGPAAMEHKRLGEDQIFSAAVVSAVAPDLTKKWPDYIDEEWFMATITNISMAPAVKFHEKTHRETETCLIIGALGLRSFQE